MSKVAQKLKSVTLEPSEVKTEGSSVGSCPTCGRTLMAADVARTEVLSFGGVEVVCHDCVALEHFNEVWEAVGVAFFSSVLKQLPDHLRIYVLDDLEWSTKANVLKQDRIKLTPEHKASLRVLSAGDERTAVARLRSEAVRVLKVAILELEAGDR